jgi:hypothetical protein
MIRILKTWAGVLLTAALVACGGGGGSPGATGGSTGGGGGTTTAPQPASVELFASAPQLSSATNSSLTFTVVVKDANNQAIPSRTVTFSASSGNLIGSLPTPATGPAGEAITGVGLTPGADPTVRDITVTATAGGITSSIVIPVVGTSVSVTGDPSIILGGTTTFTAKAVDSAGNPVGGRTMTVTSALGNGLSASTLTTDVQGNATFVYTATRAGQDTLTVSGLGTTARTLVSISADDFGFQTPAPNATVAIGASQTVSVRYLTGGAPAVGRSVTFSTTRGTITPVTATTDASGVATATVSSTTSGPASIVAQSGNAQTTLPITFVATTPATVVLQANPGAVLPNTNGGTLNQATLQATVRDAAGNPVAGRVVNFTAVADGSNGTISPGSGTTNSAGQVSVQFIPGPLTTANDGVIIRASVQGTAVTATGTLTVSGQALFISIAAGNVVSNVDVTTYQKQFSVYVTDANGAPAANRVVNLSVLPDQYGKGTLAFFDPPKVWGYATVVFCPNEDTNRNGILDSGEDANGDGRLQPGLPVIVTPASVTTGSNGFATFFLQYGENYVPWVSALITARTSVGGTESVKTFAFPLEGVAGDFNQEAVAPAGVVSPFGTVASCQSPN